MTALGFPAPDPSTRRGDVPDPAVDPLGREVGDVIVLRITTADYPAGTEFTILEVVPRPYAPALYRVQRLGNFSGNDRILSSDRFERN